jgi:hypothetical protein
MPLFQHRYWGEDADSEEKDQSWHRINGDWLDACSSMALQLDSATNLPPEFRLLSSVPLSYRRIIKIRHSEAAIQAGSFDIVDCVPVDRTRRRQYLLTVGIGHSWAWALG